MHGKSKDLIRIVISSLVAVLLLSSPALASSSISASSSTSASSSSSASVSSSAATSVPATTSAVSTSASVTQTTDTMKVGLYESPNYSFRNDDGSYAGADIEYAYRIAQKAGLNIEISLYQSDQEMLQALDDGEVDVLFDFGMTDKLKESYLFSENPIGSSALSVYTRNDDDRFTYGDIDQLADKVFGYPTSNYIAVSFKKWCDDHGLAPKLVEYASTDEVDAALTAGDIDAGIIGQNGHEGYTTTLTFSRKPYYLLFRKGDAELKNKVDTAMNQILVNDSLYEEKLLQKYGISTLGVAGFSSDEKSFIASHAAVRVAVVADDYPYFSRSSDGTDKGIIPDYYSKLAEFSGLTFVYQVYDSNTDAIAAVRDGDADVLAMFSDGIITAEEDDLLLTDAYETVDSVLLTRAGTDSSQIKKVAVKERSVNNVRQNISSLFDAQIVPVTNAKSGFQELKDGNVDAVICGLPTATWLMNQTNSSAYSTLVLSSMQFELCGATTSDGVVLASILDKAINATNYAFEGIVEDNTVQEDTLKTVISRISPLQIIVIASIMLAVALVLIFALISIVRRQKERAVIAQAQAENEKKQLQLEAIERNAEERNRFFSDVSHDMRTPLTAILGFSELIDGETDMKKIKEDNDKIRNSGKLLLDLINDTLTLSKVGSNKLTLNLVPVDSKYLFDSVIEPIRIAADAKHITFRVDRSNARQRTILADPLNVQKVILNLLTNAVKYTPEGGRVDLILSNEPQGSPDPDSVIIVRDDGIGMSDEFQEHMFEPFSQERRAGYGGSGTGLGLSIVNQLVNLMGGTIDVTSTKGEGTTITVRLHFQESTKDPTVGMTGRGAATMLASSAGAMSAEGAGSDAEGGDAAEAMSGGHPAQDDEVFAARKVLLCEDNAMNQEIVSALLQKKGMSVATASDGKEGLGLFQKSAPGEFSLVLMDIRMPNMDGRAATRAIRSLDRADAKTVPIIAMTADAFEEDVKECLEAGMDAHVAKPIEPEQFYATLRSLLQ